MTAAIYTRYSPGEDREKTSTTANQIAMCEEYAQQHGWKVSRHHIYSDEFISGATDDRPAFQQMLEDIESGGFPDILVTKDTSRLARNELQAGIHKDWIRKKGIQIRFVLQDFGDSDEGWFTERQMDLMAEFFRRKKAKEIYAYQRQNALKGYSNGGRPPYGYQRKEVEVDGKIKVAWELNPKEAPIVHDVFTWHLEGAGAKEICRRLTHRGERDRKGKPFAYSSILEWFKSPHRFAGFRCWNVRDENMKRNPKSEWIMIPDAHPAIITLEQADKVYAMSEKRKPRERIDYKRQYLLTGFLVCDLCGSAFQGENHKTKGKTYYRCALRRRRGGIACENKTCLDAPTIEQQIIDQILPDLREPDFFRAWADRINQEIVVEETGAVAKYERLESQLEEVQVQIDALVDAIAKRTMPLEEIEPRMQDLSREKYRLQGEMRAIQKGFESVKLLSDDEMAVMAEMFEEKMSERETNIESCRDMLSMFVKRIRVQSSGDCTLEYRVNTFVHAIISSATGNRTPV